MAYERSHEVRLYMYDISYGLASLSSEFFLGKCDSYNSYDQEKMIKYHCEDDLRLEKINLYLIIFLDKKLDGIWHTSIVVYGKEFYYGRSGITIERPVSFY